jgi:hypothetical protein
VWITEVTRTGGFLAWLEAKSPGGVVSVICSVTRRLTLRRLRRPRAITGFFRRVSNITWDRRFGSLT